MTGGKWIRRAGRLAAAVLAAVLLAGAACGNGPWPAAARAEEELLPSYTSDALGYQGHQMTWKELGVEKTAKLAVFSAPFEDSWRGAKGKASVSAAEAFTLLGTLQGGRWGMIRYSIDGSSGRIGWIRMPESAGPAEERWDLNFLRTPLRVAEDAVLTDDPLGSRRSIRMLKAGETVIGMFAHTDEGEEAWVYAEAEAEGKTAWGFVPAAALRKAEPMYRVEGTALIVLEGVTSLGDSIEYTDLPEPDQDGDDYRVAALIRPGDIALTVSETEWLGVRTVSLPSTLRTIGPEGLSRMSLAELRLGGGILVQPEADAFYADRIERLVLGADYTGPVPDSEYLRVGRWEVEPGNPRYRSMDGMLYTADGKTLLRYPNGSEAEHCDVPAGTEEIADSAFSDDGQEIPLKSVSLPIGLKRIGKGAFSGCGRLVSLAVPLTVREVDETAFSYCVSLERLSMPPGFSARLSDWVEPADFTLYNGDNGATLSRPPEKDSWEEERDARFRSYQAALDTETGEGSVPLFSSADGTEPVEEKPAGTQVTVYEVTGGRARISGSWEDFIRWAPLERIRGEAGELFFTVEDAEPLSPSGREGARLVFGYYEDGEASFYAPPSEDEIVLPCGEVRLYRARTGDGRRMGIVTAEGGVTQLLDAPGKAPVGHVYNGTQAVVKDEDEGWLRVETGYGEGWIPAEALIPVEELPEGAA